MGAVVAQSRRARPRPAHGQFGLGPDEPALALVNLLFEDHSQPDARGRHCLLLDAYAYRWYRVGGLDYLLKRSEA